jgi:hypothetical protein
LAYDSAVQSLPEVEGQDALQEELARSILNLAALGIAHVEQLRDAALGTLDPQASAGVES